MQREFASLYGHIYAHHWWWRMREAVVLDRVQGLGLRRPARILDVGCGDGLLFPALSHFGEVTGIEIDPALLTDDGPWRERIHTEPLTSRRFDGQQFDLILALDVLEHIEHDRDESARLVELMAPGGRALVTVPASPALWDEHDRLNAHWRRYTQRTLSDCLTGHGARLVELRYLFHWLYLPKLLVTRLNALRRQKVAQHQIPPAWLNRALMRVCAAEYALTRGLRLPFGTSLLAILEKPGAGR